MEESDVCPLPLPAQPRAPFEKSALESWGNHLGRMEGGVLGYCLKLHDILQLETLLQMESKSQKAKHGSNILFKYPRPSTTAPQNENCIVGSNHVSETDDDLCKEPNYMNDK